MQSSQYIIEKLKQLGLTENEVTIYLFLIKREKCTIQEISKKNGIPRSTVYETLNTLLSKGLIQEVIEYKKKEYKANPLNILKYNFLEEQAKLEKNIKNLDTLESTIESAGIYPSHGINNFEIRKFVGKAGARQLFWNTFTAKDTVLVYSYFGRSNYVGKQFYKNFVSESKARGVHEKVIINPFERVINLLKKDLNTPLARTNLDDIRSLEKDVINIKGETFIYNDIFATVYLDKEDIVGFEIENKDFADTQRSIFNSHWEAGQSLELKSFL